MIKLVGLLILPSLIFSPIESDKTTSNVQISAPEQYAIVSEKLFECYENAIPYAQNRDKSGENNEIRTLEERKEEGAHEKGPLASNVSGEESVSSIESVIDMLDTKFEYMYELKATLDEREKESAKMWNEYYAIKEVYDRAVAKYTEKWAQDNGILLAKNHSGAPTSTFRMKR